MIAGVVFALVALFMATFAVAKGIVVWSLLTHGAADRAEKPGRYWARVVFKIADCALQIAVAWIAACASLSNFGLIGPWNLPSLQN